MARSPCMLFIPSGSLLACAVLVFWLARFSCCSLIMARSRHMLFSTNGSLSPCAVLHRWLAQRLCCSANVARSNVLLFRSCGSLRLYAVPSCWLLFHESSCPTRAAVCITNRINGMARARTNAAVRIRDFMAFPCGAVMVLVEFWW